MNITYKIETKADDVVDVIASFSDILDTEDVAYETGRTVGTVRRWIRTGRLPAVRFGGSYLISRRSVPRIKR